MLQQIPSQSLQQLLSRSNEVSRSLGASSLGSVSPHDVIHVQGSPSTGKSQLLYYITATCLLPRNANGGGWNKVALIYDVDGRFCVSRLRDLIFHRLRHLPQATIAEVLGRCLHSIRIFKPASTEQLTVSLASIPLYHATKFPNSEIGLIGIHSVDAFYWSDRFKGEQLHMLHPTEMKPTPYHALGHVITDLQSKCAYVVVLTHWGLIHGNSNTFVNTSNIPRAPNFQSSLAQNFLPAHLDHLPITQHIKLEPEQQEDRATITGVCHRTDATTSNFVLHITNDGVEVH